MTSSTTKTTEREQWRARILRALAELDTEPRPGRECRAGEDLEQDGTTTSSTDV